MATLALAKDAEGTPALSPAVALAVQARLKLKDSVELFQEAYRRETGEAFNSRCTWTFEMPPIQKEPTQ